MKNVFYIPNQLIKAKEEIKLAHKRSVSLNDKKFEEDLFKKFVKILVKTKTTRVLDVARTYEPEMITKLSFYIHTNKFNVNCKNLYIVLLNLANDSDWENIFSEWQDLYQNEEVRKLIVNACSKTEEFNKFKENNLPDANIDWLKEDNIVDYLCKQFSDVDSEKIFGDTLTKLGVLFDKQLYITCLKKFLLHCSRLAYLNTETNKLLSSYYGYIESEKIQFIHNFVSKLTIEELDNQERVYEAIKQSTSIKEKLKEYLKKMGLYDKYSQWMERMKLMLAFEGDRDRFDFWIKYQKGNQIIDTNRDTLYIDFGNYVITEFKGKSAGPTYLFKKEFFNKVVYSEMRYRNKADLRNYLRNLYDRNKALERLEHKPINRGWWKIFSYTLSNYGIEPSN